MTEARKSPDGQHILTDWRGREFTIGTEIVYPRMSGRSVEMSDGVVVDIWQAYRSKDTWNWKRHTPNTSPEDISGDSLAWRVKVKPHDLGSRGFYRGGWSDYFKNRDSGEPTDVKPVTLINIENITVLGDRFPDINISVNVPPVNIIGLLQAEMAKANMNRLRLGLT